MAAYYPPVGFHFTVDFSEVPDSNSNDNQFQSVSGLSVDLETEEIAEGGENRFKYKIPVRTKYPNLVLKRGMLVDSGVIEWVRNAVEDFDILPVDIRVTLLDEKHESLQTWNVVHAYPVKWSVADLNAEENKIVIETIELTYHYFKIL
ncbi:MAG: phage tail protein [Flavobacteriaceae bacterium]|nr:phage tail protein [Flavobacteriaceae bacterium]